MIAAFGARGASERTGRRRAVDGRVETEPYLLCSVLGGWVGVVVRAMSYVRLDS